MTDTLVRLTLSGTSDFHPLALAPGLPMLDSKKLTYQVMLGWFNDLLAEPDLDEEGVRFHVQRNGLRQPILERSLVTDDDLAGPLSADFERLKKALFDVHPVSPSERLIFNRLQPPIGNHDGFLFRVRTEVGVDRLVWCWGYQLRAYDGPLAICRHPTCREMFVKQVEMVDLCPRCGESLTPKIASKIQPKRRRPIGAFAAAGILAALAGGTYFYAATAHNDATHDEPLLAGLENRSLNADEKPPTTPPAKAITPAVKSPRAADQSPPKVAPQKVVKPLEVADANQTRPLFAGPGLKPEAAPVVPVKPVEVPLPKPTEPVTRLPDPKPISTPPVKTPVKTDVRPPVAISLPVPEDIATAKPAPTKPITNAAKPTIETPQPVVSKPAVVLSPAIEKPSNDVPVTPTPTKNVAALVWHQDYLAGYQQAMQAKRPLLMQFRDISEPDVSESRIAGFGDPELQPLLENFVRVSMPVGATVPGQTPGQAPSRLLDHRSFRHLNGKAGVVIIDLTEPNAPNFARVVSALPLPPDGRFSPEILGKLLQLPAGSIGQRSLLLAIRTATSAPDFTVGEQQPLLDQLANRNARLMAQAEIVGSYDQGARVAAITDAFGTGAKIGELLYATDGSTTVQEAAISAVRKWLSTPADKALMSQPATAFGIELFQSQTSQRWFATCVLVTK